ncbi:hypothetical protein TNCV_1390321 [Trichonephila clavipes]|nr:hypothetical protein TNCV_1390321 [Trichonephila clavipes]
MRISHKRHLEDNIRRVIADIRHKCWKKSSKIGRPEWTTSERAVAVLCQKSYLEYLRDLVEDDQRSGRPSSSRTPEIIEKVRNFVLSDHCSSLRLKEDSSSTNKREN